ncbi:MAG: hypothetical protein J6B01_12640 [Ruminococcus sp.]|nr:hypothetical protein [Ruminococcus sp.]
MSIDIRIVSKRLEYKIRLEEKITFICGDSATGKTQMTRLIENADDPSVEISVSNGFEMINMTRSMFNNWIKHADKQASQHKLKGIKEYFSDPDNFPVTEKIIVIDDETFVMSADFSEFVNADKYNYYIIINRTQIARIGCSVNGAYNFMANGRYHWIERRYKATPHKDRLAALYRICLRFSRHLAQKLLDRRQPACVVFIQSDEKIDCASPAQSLCGVAITFHLRTCVHRICAVLP